MSNKWTCNSVDELPALASQIINTCKSSKIALYGEMGVGKTTLIKEICKQLGIHEIVDSPTYTILNEYQGKVKVNHFDFYRLKKVEELYELGYEEYFFSDDYVLIEWPEKIEELLPDHFMKLSITVDENNIRAYCCL
ncbi:MAG: tRNA (adenosine(37)-N6)-threonylcarbamoyltransferase complex ATPase subunit type 1 TsaE [Bacteroidetes bacterium]|nr:tRNA (adenosine(37)-N6)-threonylcarbamoyltransferase complex ATPase subunit type 1 TsaE [Bacteroidota bacterium]